jgi:hypothetical protein
LAFPIISIFADHHSCWRDEKLRDWPGFHRRHNHGCAVSSIIGGKVLFENARGEVRSGRRLVATGQRAGAHAHKTIELLGEFFGQRIIRRSQHLDENTHWPAWSCDLSSCDFWFWNFVKAAVRHENLQTLFQLEQCMINAFNQVNREMCNRVFNSFVMRLEKCVETGGRHLEKNEIFN